MINLKQVKDSNMELYKRFKERIISFKSENFSKLKLGFAFGLMMRSYYLIKDYPEFTKDKVELSHSLFSKDDVEYLLPQILITQNAEDDTGNSDLDFIEQGVKEHKYILERAIEFNRPDYCMFFVIGLLRGGLNSQSISEREFAKLLKIIPSNFVINYGGQIVDMCNYFDETDTKIKVENGEIELKGMMS